MTLSARNNFFRGGIIIAILSISLVAISGRLAYAVFPEVTAKAVLRSGGLILRNIELQAEANVPFWTIMIAAVFSLVSISLIYYFFEKTQSPEIFFIGLFVISLSFEAARIIIPLREIFNFPLVFVATASRVMHFGRCFGLFSLFTAGIYAAGLDAQKQGNSLLMITLAALIISMSVPINCIIYDSAFVTASGYRHMFSVIEAGILVITMSSFLISASKHSSRNFLLVGIGIILAVAGRNILLNSDTWITPFPGLMILIAGTWFACSRLHLAYLWL